MLTLAAVERLVAEGCRLVLVACNTASAIALRRLQQGWLPAAAPEHRVLGVFVPMVEVLAGVSWRDGAPVPRSEEHPSELQSLMRISYAVFCLKKKKRHNNISQNTKHHISNTTK